MLRIISATILFTFVLGDHRPLDTCVSSAGSVEDSAVIGCKFVNGRYILKRDTNVGIQIKFDTNKEVQKVIAAAKGIINGIPINYPLPEPDGCTVLQCPLQKGGPFSYTATLPVSRMYPKIFVTVEWELKNENDEVIACVQIPAKIE